jgi:hypothetical protein
MYYQGLSEQQRQAIYQRMYYGASGAEHMSGMTGGSGMMTGGVESGMTSGGGGGDNGMTDIHAFLLPSSSYYGQPDSVSAMYPEGVSSAYAHGTPTHHPMAAHTASAGGFGFHPAPTDLQQSAHAAQSAAAQANAAAQQAAATAQMAAQQAYYAQQQANAAQQAHITQQAANRHYHQGASSAVSSPYHQPASSPYPYPAAGDVNSPYSAGVVQYESKQQTSPHDYYREQQSKQVGGNNYLQQAIETSYVDTTPQQSGNEKSSIAPPPGLEMVGKEA